jgi:hypothetical protein
MLKTVGVICTGLALGSVHPCTADASDLKHVSSTPAKANAPCVIRLPGNPIITPAMLPGADGGNINGPSLIRVPAWVKNPLGRY